MPTSINNLTLTLHQVPRAQKASWKTFGLLLYRIGLLLVWTTFSLPGVVLHAPIFVTASVVSKIKAKGGVMRPCVILRLRCSCVCRGSCRVRCKDRWARRPRNMESFDFARHDTGPLFALRNNCNCDRYQSRCAPEFDYLDALPRVGSPSVHWLRSSQVR